MHQAQLSRAILAHALLLGLAGNALLRGGPPGLGLAAWTGLIGLAMVSLRWKEGRVLSGQALAWLLTAVVFAALLAWRNSDILQFFNAVTVVGALGMAAISLNDTRQALLAPRLRDTLWAGVILVGNVVIGIAPLLFKEPGAVDSPAPRRTRLLPVFRAAALAGGLLLVFGSLLRADPLFASMVTLPHIDVEPLIGHGLVIGFLAWTVGGWARGALVPRATSWNAPDTLPVSFGLLDISAALGALTLLFAAFVATQLGWFFGGEQFLQEHTGLTAAEYAREGFFQMVWVVFLVIGVLLATRAALKPGRALAVRHTALSLPLIALVGAIIASAVMRMHLYVQYYGLTEDRVYTLVFMGWLAVVVVWLAATVLRGWGRPFVAGAAISGLVILAGLNIVGPDALIARTNISRAARESPGARPPLDLVHLAGLSGEAVPLAVRAVLSSSGADPAQRCQAAKVLLGRWGTLSKTAHRGQLPASWRSWNAGQALALRTVAEHERELLRLRRAICVPNPPSAAVS
jgi:hypothetical protein